MLTKRYRNGGISEQTGGGGGKKWPIAEFRNGFPFRTSETPSRFVSETAPFRKITALS